MIWVCRTPDIDSPYLKNAFNLANHNWYNNLSWRENLNNGWKMMLGASFSTNLDNIQQQTPELQITNPIIFLIPFTG